jgi:hypothetical protein
MTTEPHEKPLRETFDVPMNSQDCSIRHLLGELGSSVFSEYNKKLNKDFGDNHHLKSARYDQEKGFTFVNPFIISLLGTIIQSSEWEIATYLHIESVIRSKADSSDEYLIPLLKQVHDTDIVLRSTSGPNKYLSERLICDASERSDVGLKDGILEVPLRIPLQGTSIDRDDDSPYGLILKLNDDATVTPAPWLTPDNHNKSFSETTGEGKPIFIESGTRMLFTSETGMTRLSITNKLGVNSTEDLLGYSCFNNRLAFAKKSMELIILE